LHRPIRRGRRCATAWLRGPAFRSFGP
jgi:hypothetical protein